MQNAECKMQNWQRAAHSAVYEINAPTSSVGALHEAPEILVTPAHPSVDGTMM
ncbi:MAG: hypothetical protein IJW52_06080 [Clostridia bacterium]|nr:hypothetical protein [Clostridia bacterium]